MQPALDGLVAQSVAGKVQRRNATQLGFGCAQPLVGALLTTKNQIRQRAQAHQPIQGVELGPGQPTLGLSAPRCGAK